MFALPLGASAEEKTYQYFSLGWDNETDVTGIDLAAPTNNNTVTWESTNPLSGSGSLKYTFSGDKGSNWAFMAPTSALRVTNGHRYRVSLKLKASFPTEGSGGMTVNIGFATAHWQLDDQTIASRGVVALNGRTEDIQNVSKTVTAVNDGYLAFHGYTNASNDSFLLDDVVVAEIIESVTAASANVAMGTVNIANKDGKNTDFAVNETAVFTATPVDGYKFLCWKDANGDVVQGAGATYEMQVTTDTALTAYFERDAIFIQDFEEGHFDVGSSTYMSINTDPEGLNGDASGSQSLYRSDTGAYHTNIPLYSGSQVANLRLNTTYRLSFDIKFTSTETSCWKFYFSWGKPGDDWIVTRFPSGGSFKEENTVNDSSLSFSTTEWQSVSCTFTTPSSNPTYMLNLRHEGGKPFYLDNIVVREVFPEGTVTAASDNATMGTATVTNTATNKKGGTAFSDFAYKETARFTATPNEGYEFVCWKKSDDIVSTEANYEMEITDSVALTAYFQKAPFRGDLYQNFESYTITNDEIVGKAALATDPDDAENTTLYHNGTANASEGRCVLSPKVNFNNAAYTVGEQFTMRFNYKVTSTGSNNIYLYAGSNCSSAWVLTNDSFGHSTITLTQTDGWQTMDMNVTINEHISEISTGIPRNFVVFVGGNADVYLDEFMIFKTENISVNYENEAVRLVTENDSDPFKAARVGSQVTFRAECDSTVTPTVKYGNDVLTPVDGIYTITVVKGKSISVTTGGQTAAQTHAPGVGLNGEDLTKFDPDVYMNKIWEGNTVYHEPVMFAQSSDGYNMTTKELLYPVEDIVSIRSANLKTYYIKGVDYKIEDGKIVWLEGGQISLYTGPLTVPKNANASDYPSEVTDNGTVAWGDIFPTDENNGLYGIWDGYHENHTVYVTYTHNTTWSGEEGYTPAVPENQSDDMTAFYNKLAKNDNSGINVLVYGDSTATGASATGQNVNYDLFDANGNVTPRKQGGGIKAPVFFEQATAELAKGYVNSSNINYYNIALGGQNTDWGAKNLKNRVKMMNDYYRTTITPDIIYVKFCANDMKLTADEYKTNMQSIVDQFKELYPKAAIVLVSGKINNVRSTNFGTPEALAKVDAFENALADIASKETNCIVAKNTSVWKEIVKSKNCEDYLSNFVNHANDFWSMVTAQVIVASAQKPGTTESQIETAYNSAAALRTASESTTGKNGLRIYNEIKTAWIGNAEIVEYGSIAIRTELLSGAELLYNNAKAVKGVAYSNGTYSAAKNAQLWESLPNSKVFTSYLTNIPEKHYGENYTVRAYAIASDGKIYYGEEFSVSVFAIANAIDHGNTLGGTEQSEADKAAFIAFVNSNNSTAYQEWCTANKKETGKLFAEKYGSNS